MSFYILLLCGVVLSSICVSYAKYKETQLIAKFITFNILFVPAAIRYGIGLDYFNYTHIFQGTMRVSESGFNFINQTIAYFGGNAQWVFIIVSFLTYFFFFQEVETKRWCIYAPVFLCTMYAYSFNTLRQVLCIAMAFNALLKYQKGKKNRAFIIIFLSYFIHKSALFYIPILIIVNLFKFEKKYVIILFFMSFCFSVFIFPKLIRGVFSIIAMTSYSSYLWDSTFGGKAEISSGLGRMLRYLVYFLITLCLPNNKNNRKLSALFLFYITTDFLAQSILILNRIGRCVIFLYEPLTYEVYKSRKQQQLYFLIMIFCILILFYLDLHNGFYGSIPYVSIFDVR